MTDNTTEPLFFDNIYDAFKHLVQRLGGSGRVGPKLFPEKNGRAAQFLNDCLNPNEREKLDIEQILLLLKMGREVSCHSAINYICGQCGYRDPDPVAPSDELAELQRKTIEAVKHLDTLVSRMERVQNTSFRVVKV